MEILWTRGPSTVGEVVSALPKNLGLSYSTVLTTLRILEQKGYVGHAKSGQAYVYHPVINRSQAQHRALKHVLSRFFNNSPQSLVLNLVESERLGSEDLKRIQKMIEGSQ